MSSERKWFSESEDSERPKLVPMPLEKAQACAALRDIVTNEAVAASDRRSALALLLKTKGDDSARLSGIPDGDLAAIAELVSPEPDEWTRDLFGTLCGHNVDGLKLQHATERLADQRQFLSMLATIVDTSLPDSERIEAIRDLKTRFSAKRLVTHRLNRSERDLLSAVRRDNGGHAQSGALSLRVEAPARPPQRLSDVWPSWWTPSQFTAAAQE